MDTAALLADPAATRLDRIRPSPGAVTLVVKTTAPLAECPRCHRRSACIGSGSSRGCCGGGGRYIEEGLSVAEADRLALADLGSVEYWEYVAGERWRESESVAGRIERAGEFTPGDVSRQLDLWVRLSLAGAAPAVDGAPERSVERQVGPPDPARRCSRCESIGHTVEACPFSPADRDMLRVAQLRRERRSHMTEVA